MNSTKEIPAATEHQPQSLLLSLYRANWFWGLLLVLSTIVAYQLAWHAGFIWSDDEYVTQNKLLTAPDGLRRIWFSLDSPSQYFPLVYTTFRLEHALWGLNPAGYHWVNILLHAANALLVWRLLRGSARARRVAGRGDLRVASGAGGIGRLDYGTQERADGLFLSAGAAPVGKVSGRTTRTDLEILQARVGLLRAGAFQ